MCGLVRPYGGALLVLRRGSVQPLLLGAHAHPGLAPSTPLGVQASHGGVAVRRLFAASPSQLALLKQGEQEKQKSYVAVGAV